MAFDSQSQNLDDIITNIEDVDLHPFSQSLGDITPVSSLPGNQLGLFEPSDTRAEAQAKIRAALEKKRKRGNKRKIDFDLEIEEEDDEISPREALMVTKENVNSLVSSEIGFEKDVVEVAKSYQRGASTMLLPQENLDEPQNKKVKKPNQSKTPPKGLMECMTQSQEKTSGSQNGDEKEKDKLVPVHDQTVVIKGSFLLPERENGPKENVAFQFGCENYRAVLGYNTIFKVKKSTVLD